MLLGWLFPVLFGSKTWVSYAGRPNTEHLPTIRKGLVWPSLVSRDSSMENSINLAYARDYHVYRDIQAMWHFLFKNNLP